MRKYLGPLSILAPIFCVGAFSVSTLRSGYANQVMAGAGQARLAPAAKLDHVPYSVPTASTPVVVVYGAAAVAEGAEYALAETYAVDAAAWVAEQVQLGG